MNDGDARCPKCGSTFTIDPDAETDVMMVPTYITKSNPPYTVRQRAGVVAFCNGCEFVHPIDPAYLKGKAA